MVSGELHVDYYRNLDYLSESDFETTDVLAILQVVLVTVEMSRPSHDRVGQLMGNSSGNHCAGLDVGTATKTTWSSQNFCGFKI